MTKTSTAVPKPKAEKTYTVEEYLAIERQTGERHAYYDGKIVPMSGGTLSHNRIVRNLIIELGRVLYGRPDVEIFTSDQKVYLPEKRAFVYPDAVVVAGVPVLSDELAHALTNPILIFEVLSPNTYDHNVKFMEYQRIPSFVEYVLLSQDAPKAIRFVREAPDLWRRTDFTGLEAAILLSSLSEEMPMQGVYREVEPRASGGNVRVGLRANGVRVEPAE